MRKFYDTDYISSGGLPFTCQECGMPYDGISCKTCHVIAVTKRTVGELYRVILDVQKSNVYNEGICGCISIAFRRKLITEKQKEQLRSHLYLNRPVKYSWWWWTSDLKPENLYWWPLKCQRVRRRFLKYLAKKYKNTTFT